MTKTQRTILVFTLVALFFLITPAIILYSQGYRFDWATKQITQTGGFYFKVIPSRADISINGAFAQKTDFIFDSALLGNFIPKSYQVRISKDGYAPWVKTLEINPKEVTEAKNILLFPSKIDFQTLYENVANFWPSPGNKKIILQKAIPGQKWQLYLWDLENNDQKFITKQKNAEDIFDIFWSQDSSKILVQLATGDTLENTVWNLIGGTNDPCVQTSCAIKFSGQTIANIFFSPSEDGEIFYLTGSQSILKANYLVLPDTATPIARNALAFMVNSNGIFWLDQNGVLWEESFSANASPVALNATPYLVQPEIDYKIFQFGEALFLQENQRVLLRLTQDKKFEKVLTQTLMLTASPSKTKIAIANDSEIWIYYLENQNDQPIKKAGDLSFLTRFSQKPENLLWINDHELIFSAGNTIRTLETDDRDSLNSVDIAAYPAAKLFWQNQKKTLTILSEGNIYSSEKLLP